MIGRRFAVRRTAKKPDRSRGVLRRILDIVLTVAILGVLILVAARLGSSDHLRLEGQVRVTDGDSIVLDNERIRLRGIDAPELNQTCGKDGASYPCGRMARDELVGLTNGKPVTCQGSERDRYGRLLAVCLAGGVEINRRLVRSGWAVAYGDFEGEEDAARQAGLGLWASSFDRPHDWRSKHGGMAESEHASLRGLFNWLRHLLRFF